MEAASSTPTPQQVLLPSVIDTRLLKRPVAFDGDRTEWADWAFTFRANASPVSSRMVVWMEHAESATGPLDLPTEPSAMLVKDGAMKKARNALVGHSSEIWRLLCEEYEPRQRRRLRAMLSAVLRVQLREPLGEFLDGFERQVHAYEDQSGKPIQVEIVAAIVIAAIDNATVAQHLALNVAALDTYSKIMNAVNS